MTSVASPFQHSAPPPKRRKDTAAFTQPPSSSPLSSYTHVPSSPSLLSYPSPFYSSMTVSSLFAPPQSPFMSPLPPGSSLMLDVSTPSVFSLATPSTAGLDMQLPPAAISSKPQQEQQRMAAAAFSPSSVSALSSAPASPSPSASSSLPVLSSPPLSLLYTTFPFNSQLHPILTAQAGSAMLPASDEDDEERHADSLDSLSAAHRESELAEHSDDTVSLSSLSHPSTPTSPDSAASLSSAQSHHSPSTLRLSKRKLSARIARSEARQLTKGKAAKATAASPTRASRPHKKEKPKPAAAAAAASVSPSSSAAPGAAAGAPLSAAGLASAAALAKQQTGGSGLSCHQCKTRKLLSDLYTCGNYERRKRTEGDAKKLIRPCRKKYCQRCLLKFYGEQPPCKTDRGSTSISYQCPSCRAICGCAACRKRLQVAAEEEASNAQPLSTASTDSSSDAAAPSAAASERAEMSVDGGVEESSVAEEAEAEDEAEDEGEEEDELLDGSEDSSEDTAAHAALAGLKETHAEDVNLMLDMQEEADGHQQPESERTGA